MAYVRTVKTSSGATAVQIVWSWRKGSRSIEHLGSAHDDVELAALKAAAAERLAAGQTELDLGISAQLEPGTLPILSSQMTHLWETLCVAYRALGFESATKSDNVFRDLVLARIIEPTSKIDAERVLTESVSVPRRMPRSSGACRVMPNPAGAKRWLRSAQRMRDWGQRAWCCSTSRRCTSRPMPATGSVSPDSPKRGVWSHRSPSAC